MKFFLHKFTLKKLFTIGLMFLLLFFTVGFASKCSSDKKPKKAKKSKKKSKKGKKSLKLSSKSKGKKDDSEDDEKEKSKSDKEDSDEITGKDESSKDKELVDKEKEKKEEKDKKATKNPVKKEKSSASVKEIWKDLIKGNKKFVAGKYTKGKFVSSRKKLVKGQHPEVIVIGCADSRVPPELVFDKNLGELFVIRTAGNVADPIALGSIEYAAEHLHSKVLIVLGHESCGAVGAALSKEKMPTANLRAIVSEIRPSFKLEEECKIGNDNNIKCVELNVENSAKNIVNRSPILKKLVKEEKLTVIEAVYEMESGKVVRLE